MVAIIESLLNSFTLSLYKHYLPQDVIVMNGNAVTENASLPNGDVTTCVMIVVITATKKIVVYIS